MHPCGDPSCTENHGEREIMKKSVVTAVCIGALVAVALVFIFVRVVNDEPEKNPVDSKPTISEQVSPTPSEAAESVAPADPKLEAFIASATEAVPAFAALPPERVAGYGQQICAGLKQAQGNVAAVVPGVVKQGGGLLTEEMATGLVTAAKKTYC